MIPDNASEFFFTKASRSPSFRELHRNNTITVRCEKEETSAGFYISACIRNVLPVSCGSILAEVRARLISTIVLQNLQ